MQDIHRGFQDLDQTRDAQEFLQFLDAADALDSIRRYRQWMLELCPAVPGQRILDVGCGIGHASLRLASVVGESGRIVGVDRSEAFIAEARRRAADADLRVSYQTGDARHLPFAAATFDLCRTERVLMYLENPEHALDEVMRVLRPNGRFALFEFDYEGIVVDATDRALTRDLVRLVADSVPSPWLGRQLPRLVRERGGDDLTVIPHMIVTPLAMFRRVVAGTIAQAVHAGRLASAEVEAWWAELEQADRSDRFFAGFAGFLVCGRAA